MSKSTLETHGPGTARICHPAELVVDSGRKRVVRGRELSMHCCQIW